MIAGSYYVDYLLTVEESTRRFASAPIPGSNPPQWSVRGCNDPGHYTVAIRRRRTPGWVFRLHGDFPRHEAFEIVANLNAPHRLERAA